MGSAQLAEWLAYQRVRGPLGPQRGDLMAVMVLGPILTALGARFDAEDLLPRWRAPREDAETPEEALARLEAAFGEGA